MEAGARAGYLAQHTRSRPLWDAAFVGGSYCATFLQGTAVGALVRGLTMDGARYVGGAFGWFSPFALLCGVGLCLGYALMGAGWLTYKSRPDVRDLGFRLMPRLLAAVLLFLALAFAFALSGDLSVTRRWAHQPILVTFPALGAAACMVMVWAVRRRRELTPFLCAVVLFAAGLGTLAVSFYPYMIPFAITTFQAAAPDSSMEFMFWGIGAFVLPLTIVYTLVVYFTFKGKVVDDEAY